MLFCHDPYPLSKPGDGRKFNPLQNRVDYRAVACGRCKACAANRKQCWTAKLVAESLTSVSATFVTLTYAKDPEGVFRYSDVQEFLHRLRKWALRKHGAQVRFFCQGENGDQRDRVHWHLMLFFDKALKVPVPKMNTLSQFWDYGWTNVQNLTPERVVEKARYTAKYVAKRTGQGCRPRCSLKPGLGHVWLMQHARETAEAALVPNGKYAVPGMVWTRGPRKGQTQWMNLRGSQIAHYIREWRASWERNWSTDPPSSPWLAHYDESYVDPVHLKPTASRWRLQQVGKLPKGRFVLPLRRPLADQEDAECWSQCLIASPDGWAAWLRVQYYGPERFRAELVAENVRLEIDSSIAEVLELPPDEVRRLDKWIARQRGPEWSVERGQEAKERIEAERCKRREAKAALRESLREFCRDSREREASRAGIVLSAASRDQGSLSARAIRFARKGKAHA